MKRIKVYTINNCPYCVQAKNLLNAKGIKFEEINITDNEDYIINKLAKKTGIHTLPQIFSDQKFIGGCDDIFQLERQNNLETALFS